MEKEGKTKGAEVATIRLFRTIGLDCCGFAGFAGFADIDDDDIDDDDVVVVGFDDHVLLVVVVVVDVTFRWERG